MAETAPLRVQLIAKTEFLAPPDVPWSTDADGGPALVEFAGRACYQSWSKPNPRTATNAGYLRHIIDVGHFSVLEHATVSFYITGDLAVVHPRADPPPPLLLLAAVPAVRAGARLAGRSASGYGGRPGTAGDLHRGRRRQPRRPTRNCWPSWRPSSPISPTRAIRRKQARQAARAVLPNATETRIVVTGNYRAWRHFIAMRASEQADVEIRRLAIACLRQLVDVAPQAFADFEIATLADGTEVATSPLATEADSWPIRPRADQRVILVAVSTSGFDVAGPAGHRADRDGDAVRARRLARHRHRRAAGHPPRGRRMRRPGAVGHHR